MSDVKALKYKILKGQFFEDVNSKDSGGVEPLCGKLAFFVY